MQLEEKLVVEKVEYETRDPGFTTTDWENFTDDNMMQQYNAIQAAATVKIPYVGDKEPLSVLSEEYQSGSPILLEKIQVLSESYASIRRIRGDGNCFFRSFMFSYLEHILESQDKAEVDRLTANIEHCKMTLQRLGYANIELCKKTFQNLGYADFTFKDMFALFLEQLGNLLQGNESSISHEDLVQRSRDKSVSDYVVMFFRIVTSGEIRSRSEFFKPFILGLANMTVDEYCKTSVEPMGEVSDNIQITALSDALGVPIRVMYLDRISHDAKGVSVNHYDVVPTVGDVPNTSKDDADSVKPSITLLYRPIPGHYDILYPKQSESSVNPEWHGDTTLTEHERMEEQINLQRTVFIENLPSNIYGEEVRQRFAVFGKILSYFPVLHEFTWRPTGTGCLKFSTPAEADAAVAAAQNSVDSGILLKGTQLTVIKALDKKAARDKELEKAKNDDVDQRNLHLANEGVILKDSPGAEDVSVSDMIIRQLLEKRKKEKLESPDFHVSKTRLAVYNFPATISEEQLKKIFRDAVLSKDSKQTPVIQQLKILDTSKAEKAEKIRLPRGTAFIEFSEHQHARAALEVLNNNRDTFGSEHRPIVGFAVENIQTLKRLREKLERWQARPIHHYITPSLRASSISSNESSQ